MFSYWYLPSILAAAEKLPKEFVYAAAAYFTITEMHKRHTQVQSKSIESNAKVRIAELEVEKLGLQLELEKIKAEKSQS